MDRETAPAESVVVETANGRLVGLRRGPVASFKGIPFGRPPVGPLRWRYPEPAEPWAGMRDATNYGPSAPQAPSRIESFLSIASVEQSEDCLSLNVWTPGLDGPKRPVMVWMHGGAFVFGSGSHGVYKGRALAEHDVVVVTVNYRLGALGFLALGPASGGRAPGTGTEGLADQILALDWVRRNIAAFGGDPDNVTIFGESAGAMSVAALMASPMAKGLFHKAIAQSGAGHVGNEPERAIRVAEAVLAEMGLSPKEAGKACDAPYGAVIAAQIAVFANASAGRDTRRLGAMPFQPSIDGALLPVRPIAAIRSGSAKHVPLLTGTTKEEWKLFTAADPRLRMMSAQGLSERMEKILGDGAVPILQAYADGTAFDRFNAIMTDKSFAVPAARMLDAQSQHAPTFAYRFAWRSPLLGGIFGACHALDIGFVFGTHNQKLANMFFGAGPEADALARSMMTAWSQFARTGAPSDNDVFWPAYDSDRQSTMIFGDGSPRVSDGPGKANLALWDSVADRKLGP